MATGKEQVLKAVGLKSMDSMGNSLCLPIPLYQESALTFVGNFSHTVPILLKFIYAEDIMSAMSTSCYVDSGEGLELDHK